MAPDKDDLGQFVALVQAPVECHAPSGVEAEIDEFLYRRLHADGFKAVTDDAANVFVAIPGVSSARRVVVTAHKDELGMLVGGIADGGVIFPGDLNAAFPWVYGEGPVDILGDQSVVQGVLSFGSRHVSEGSVNFALQTQRAILWRDTWIETKLSPHELAECGVRIGSRMVVARSRKWVLTLPQHYIASYALDNRLALAVLLGVLPKMTRPRFDTWFAFTSKEELGAVGAMYLFRDLRPTDVIALEICPISDQCRIDKPHAPYVIARDGHCAYDDGLTREIVRRAGTRGVFVGYALLARFGSDGSIPMKYGHVPRAACLSIPTANSHGFEIASINAACGVARALKAFLEE